MNTTLPSELASMLNQQRTHERENVAIYEGMASAFDEVQWTGFGHWMRKQAAEEQTHANLIYEYLNDRDVAVEEQGVQFPPEYNGGDAYSTFRSALDRESITTKRLTGIWEMAFKFSDIMTLDFVQKMIHEQVEEEAQLIEICAYLARARDPASMILMDDRLGKR